MKLNTPMKSLKHYIDLISSALGKDYLLTRLDMQGEKQDSEYSFGTKGIQADHVIFWTERCDSLGEREVRRHNKTKHIMANPSIGFSFQYLELKSPLVIFSFVAPHKEKNVEYSLPFTVEETRTLLKSIMKQEFETPDHLMMTLRKCFLDLQIEDQCVLGAVSNRADVIKNEKEFFGGIIAEKINPAMELMEAFPAAKKEMDLGLARLRDKLKETPEHKAVIEARKALRIAEEKLAEKRSELLNVDSELIDASEIVNSASNRPCLGDVLAETLSKLIGLAITDDDIRTKVRIGLINKAHKTLIYKFNPLIMLGEVGDEYRLNSVINDFRQKLQQQRKQ